MFSPEHEGLLNDSLPLELLDWDHYTLICEDAAQCAAYHEKAMGYRLEKIQKINSGTVGPGEFDMLNYIMRPTHPRDNKVLVITEGLNDDTIFRKYLRRFGPGIHHVAYTVADVDAAFSILRGAGYKTTSEFVMKDLLTGLKQFFISSEHAGYFIELIERGDSGAKQVGQFMEGNMAGLAQSIGKYVEDDQSRPQRATAPAKARQVSPVVAETTGALPTGFLPGLHVATKNVEQTMAFLRDALGFRTTGDRRMTLPKMPSHFVRFEEMDKEEETALTARVGVVFQSSQPGSKGERVGPADTTYPMYFEDAAGLAASREVVSYGASTGVLTVNVEANLSDVNDFLADPTHLSQWTAHRSIRRSRSCAGYEYEETRMNPLTGSICAVPMRVNSTRKLSAGKQQLYQHVFEWKTGMQVTFQVYEQANLVTVGVDLGVFRGKVPETKLASITRILRIELNLLKAVLEGNTEHVASSLDWGAVHAYHLQMNTPDQSVPLAPAGDVASKDLLASFGFKGEILVPGAPGYAERATDFGLVVHTQPLAVLLPRNALDVSSAVRAASALGIKIAPRGGKISHSAGGQAQANRPGYVVDLTLMDSIRFSEDHDSVQVGPGATWHALGGAASTLGRMPPVTTDYQNLSVGGTISMGGVGFMSHTEGIQAGRVLELEVVDGLGNIHLVGPGHELFDAARAGLGQFGIITNLRIPLLKSPESLTIAKVFYHEDQADLFVQDQCTVVTENRCACIHSSLKPFTRAALAKVVGDEEALETQSPPEFLEALGAAETKLIFCVEYALYDTDDTTALLKGLNHIKDAVWLESDSFFEYVNRAPPVININQEQGGEKPHPSVASTVSASGTVALLEKYIKSDRICPDNVSGALINPLTASAVVNRSPTPMYSLPNRAEGEDIFFLVLLLGTALPATPERIQEIRTHQRSFFDFAKQHGGKRYPYDSYVVEDQAAWVEHYGPDQWATILSAKRTYDPLHVFAGGVSLF